MVTVKHIFTRPSLHDVYWVEILDEDTATMLYEKFVSKFLTSVSNPEYNYNKVLDQPDKIRPDIRDQLIKHGQYFYLFYDPLSSVITYIRTIESVEAFRKTNRETYDIFGAIILNAVTKSNNTITEEVYDEQGNFMEYGLFNMKTPAL